MSSTLLTPTSAHTLALNELKARQDWGHHQDFTTGHRHIDNELLLGGLSRGTVAGFSAEDDDEAGLTLSFELIIRSIYDENTQMALIITPTSSSATLRLLKHLATKELASKTAQDPKTSWTVSDCLNKVFVSCIFDIDGIWQIITELESHISQKEMESRTPANDEEELYQGSTEEIRDSDDDEDDFSLGSTDSCFGNTKEHVVHEEELLSEASQNDSKHAPCPDIIVISGFSSLSTSLFAQRERLAAHTSLSSLSVQLRCLAKSLPSNPLIIIHNSTTSDMAVVPPSAKEAFGAPSPHVGLRKNADPTLTSIFSSGSSHGHYLMHSPRQNKPKFGLIFSQFLDLHLLFSRIPPYSLCDPQKVAGTNTESHATTGSAHIVEILFDHGGKQTLQSDWKNREQCWVVL